MSNQLTKREQAALAILAHMDLAERDESKGAINRAVYLSYLYADALLGYSAPAKAVEPRAEQPQTETPVQAEQPQTEAPQAAQTEQVYTLDDVRAKVTEVMKADKSKKASLQALLKNHGADRVSELDESKFAAVIDAIEKGEF